MAIGTLTLAEGADGKAAVVAQTVQDTWSLPGILGGGVKTNDAYVDGSFFLTVPAYSSIGRDGWLAGDVIFIEPYTSWGEQGEVAASLGLGWRHLFSEQRVDAVTHHDGHQAGFLEEGAFIGANLFFDMLDTQYENRFWQLGFGLEAGTRYFEVRANYYLPLSDRQLAEEIRTQTDLGPTTEATYAEPFGSGHTIQQDVTWTTYSNTFEQLFRRYEDGMEGWDAEVALLVPWLDRWVDVKLIGGYYSLDNQSFGPQPGSTGKVEGWKAGVEVRPVPAVVLNATWYEDKGFTGSDWIAGVHLELPFEAGDLGDGKGFWDRIHDAFRPRRRHLAERMIEPVRRQNDAVKVASSVEEDVSARKVVTKVISQTSRRIVLANTVVFVDNEIGSPTNPGTYEAPLDTIANGMGMGNTVFGTNAIVLVQGRPASYAESVTITQGIKLYGSGSFPGLGGKFFKGRTDLMPTVAGGFFASNVPGTVQVSGFNITGGLVGTPASATTIVSAGSGIFFENVTVGIITGNRVQPASGSTAGIWAEANAGSSYLRIEGNTVVGGGNGIGVQVGNSASASGDITGNYVTATPNGAGISVSILDNATGQFTLSQNRVIDTLGGIAVITMNDAMGDFTLTGNIVTGTFMMQGMSLLAYDNSRANFNVIGNRLEANAGGGLFIMSGDPGVVVNAFVSDNTVIFNTGDQIMGRELGGQLNFLSGTLSNDVREAAGNVGNLYNAIGGTENGFIRINGVFHRADLDLP